MAALLHSSMVIAPPPAASLLHKRQQLPEDIASDADAGLPMPKRWCPGVPNDDGDFLLLDHLGAGSDEREDTLEEEEEEEEEDADPTPHLQWLPLRLELDVGSAYVPKEGEHPQGEDAHFVSEERNAFGIADGVGGWTKRGVDAGEFARQLMGFCKAELEQAPCGSRGSISSTLLQGVLERALAKTTARGSSTALLAAVDGRVLRAVNVGDGELLVVRGDEVVYHSPSQQRWFNRPYQLGGVDRRDPPECARRLQVRIEPGDVIVAGSDGLFDNLFDDEVQEVVARAQKDGLGAPEQIAHAVARAAVEASYQEEQATPFTQARWEAGLPYSGGKPDDVTVVVARVR